MHARLLRTLLLFILTCCATYTQAQNKRSLDSLRRIAITAKHDTIRARAYYTLAENFIGSKQVDSSLAYIERSLAIVNKHLPATQGAEKKTYLNLKALDLYAKGATTENIAKDEEVEKLFLESRDIYLLTGAKRGLADLYRKMGSFYRKGNRYDEALDVLEKALKIYEGLKLRLNVSQCYMFMADCWRDKAQYGLAIDYYNRAIAIKEELKDYKSLSVAYTNLGFVYNQKGDVTRSIDCSYKALKIREKINDRAGMGTIYINTGDIFLKQGDTARALENFGKALKIGEEINDKKSIAGACMYYGFYYQGKKQNEKALEYYNRTLQLREEIKDKSGQAYCLFNMSKIFMDKGDTTAANEKFNKAYALWKAVGDKRGIAGSLVYMSEAYLKKNDPVKAGELANNALEVARTAGIKEHVKLSHLLLSKIALAKKDYESAYNHYERGIGIRDSLVNNENKKAALEKDLEYQYEKKQAQLALEQEKQDIRYQEELKRKQLLFDLEVEKENSQHTLEKKELAYQEELKRKQLKSEFEKIKEVTRIENEKQKLLAETRSRQQRNIIIMVSVGLIIVFFFLVMLFNRFRLIKKQKNIIESQKQQVEHQHAEITEQKLVLEEKNKEIIDSITYASRLQEAILPPAKLWEQALPQSFVLYKPKDIVAGDFYFMEYSNGKTIFAAADCTGHGVPGAMVSVVCSNALTRAVKEYNLVEPGKILDKVRELVIETFEKSESDVKDGMDISLCVLDKQNQTLEWAGANNPLWIFRPAHNKTHEFTELRPDKQPVGKSPNQQPFSNHKVQVQAGDLIYLFTDGYADQFGGDKGKKFKSSNLRELVSSILHSDLNTQKQTINNSFERWRGELEQVDDVCVIGIRI